MMITFKENSQMSLRWISTIWSEMEMNELYKSKGSPRQVIIVDLESLMTRIWCYLVWWTVDVT